MTVHDAGQGTHYAVDTLGGEGLPEGVTLIVALRREVGECEVCGQRGTVFQPLCQEGGPGPCCDSCQADAGFGPALPYPIPEGHHTHVPADL